MKKANRIDLEYIERKWYHMYIFLYIVNEYIKEAFISRALEPYICFKFSPFIFFFSLSLVRTYHAEWLNIYFIPILNYVHIKNVHICDYYRIHHRGDCIR